MYTNDILWKSILEDTFEDFLLFFFPDSNAFFDFSRGFEYLDKELEQLFPADDCAREVRFVDKLVKVYLLDGQEEWILVHIEVQGYVDKNFAERMFIYYYRIWDNYRRRITAFAILTDENVTFLPTKFEQDFLGTKLTFLFNSYKVRDQSEDNLLKSTNPFAQVILVVKAAMRGKTLDKADLFSLKMNLARRLLTMQIPKRKIAKLMNFLKLYIQFNDRNFDQKFDSEISLISKNTHKAMGINELYLQIKSQEAREDGLKEGRQVGIEMGREEGKYATKLKLIQNLLRETAFDNITIARLVDVSVESVEQVRSKN